MEAKYISLAEMNKVLYYIKLNKSVYLRKKKEDEYFATSKCWIDVEPRNMTVLYKDETGKVRHYAFDLAEGSVHNKINPGVAIATLGKYYKIPEIKELYPEIYKDALDNEVNNIEDYIMTHLGAKKVYRAGNTKWIWKQ